MSNKSIIQSQIAIEVLNPVNAVVYYPTWSKAAQVDGLWLPSEWFDESTRNAIIVRLWQKGAQAYRWREGDVLRFAEPIHFSTLNAGWPLLAVSGRCLSSAPVRSEEISQLPQADIWIIRSAQALALSESQGEKLNPALWLDVSQTPMLKTLDLSSYFNPPIATDQSPLSTRAVLQGIPEPSSELLKLQNILRGTQSEKSRMGNSIWTWFAQGWQSSSLRSLFGIVLILVLIKSIGYLTSFDSVSQNQPTSSQPKSAQMSTSEVFFDQTIRTTSIILLGLLVTALFVYFFRLGRRFWLKRSSTAAAKLESSNSALTVDKPSVPNSNNQVSLFRRLVQWVQHVRQNGKVLRQQVKKGIVLPRRPKQNPEKKRQDTLAEASLTRLLGRQHAAFLNKTMRLFQEGKIDDALRHAIPVDSKNSGTSSASVGWLSARQSLQLSQGQTHGKSINLPFEYINYLKKTYRQAFEQLDRAGEIDRAVYVLAELLEQRSEALSYLEKHERIKQAAELALAWDMPSDTIVRLNCLANEWKIAVAVARRDQSFATAVVLLEARWPEVAQLLRMAWAKTLVEQANYLAAVDAIWRIEGARKQAFEWLQMAEQQSEHLAALSLVKRAVLFPETLSQQEATIKKLQTQSHWVLERQLVANELLNIKSQNTATAILVNALLPAWLADRSQGLVFWSNKDWGRLVKLASDRLLSVDIPAKHGAGQVLPTLLTHGSTTLNWPAPPVGNIAILDLIMLPDGSFVAALGEAGMVVFNRLGKIIQRYAIPTERLIASESGFTALALMARGQSWRVFLLDFVGHTQKDLGILAATQFAQTFDGLSWTVVIKHRKVQVLDVTQAEFTVLWQVADLDGDVVEIQRSVNIEQWLLKRYEDDQIKDVQVWGYFLPARRLFSRDSIELKNSELLEHLKLKHAAAGWLAFEPGLTQIMVHQPSGKLSHIIVPEKAMQSDFHKSTVQGQGELLSLNLNATGHGIRWYGLTSDKPKAILEWPETSNCQVRNLGHNWWVFDDTGRVFSTNAMTGANCWLALKI